MDNAVEDRERVLADWAVWPVEQCAVTGGTAAAEGDGSMRLDGAAHVTLNAPEEVWDLDSFAEIAAPVRNLGSAPVLVTMVVEDTRGDAVPLAKRRAEALVPPGAEPMWLVVHVGDDRPSPLDDALISLVQKPLEFVRRGAVLGSSIKSVSIHAGGESPIAVGAIIARGVPAPLREMPLEQAFPLSDQWGQYIHREWTSKIRRDDDLASRRRLEDVVLARYVRPTDWNQYGGWQDGDRREATGFFRVEKIDGVWWMVDPEGCRFWSHGAVRVGTRVRVGTVYRGTPLDDREAMMTLPARDSELGQFYDTEPQSSRHYYMGREGHAVYDYLEANLYRKYGKNWHEIWAKRTQRRLASWGLNTIANSSDPELYLRRQTPYTAVVYSAPLGREEHRIQASSGHWGKLPDPFDPGLRDVMERTLRTDLKESLNDPWCLGFFVDNELNWGDSCHLAEMTILSPATQHAKQAFAGDLRQRYGDIASLNTAWGTDHADWESFLSATTLPDRERAQVRSDLEAFSVRFLDAYFESCRDSVRAASPNHLYLGCRFAGAANTLVMRSAARYCDVISINRYARSIADLTLPEGLDRPILIGEFHFSALDRGPFSDGLVPVANQQDRATAYEVYLESALKNPAVIGTHWFQFYDQPTTGRFDGENFQTGLLDICDTPYTETIEACRRVGQTMYGVRG